MKEIQTILEKYLDGNYLVGQSRLEGLRSELEALVREKLAEVEAPRFSIDFFELMFLAEACIPPVPIARACFWESLINDHYHQLTSDQRKQMFHCITRNPKFDIENEDCQWFYARYNPDNQYIAYHQLGQTWVFRNKGRFYVTTSRYIPDENIVSIKKIL